jgi:hypothetical protein
MNHATDPLPPIVETPTDVYVVSTMRTLDGEGSVCVDAEFGNTKIAVTTAATVRMPLYMMARFIFDSPFGS